MPIIDGVLRNNERRTRWYGLDVGDRVRYYRSFDKSTLYATVVELCMDNNRVMVQWDKLKDISPFVAEWLDKVDEHGNVLPRYPK